MMVTPTAVMSYWYFYFITALHGMQTRSNDENSVRLPSVKRVIRDKMEERSVQICENCQRQSCKAFIGLTNRTKMIGGRRPLVGLPEILSQSDRVGAKFEQ